MPEAMDIPDVVEQQAMELVKGLHEQGMSLRAIASELETRNLRTKQGKTKWNPNQIKRLLIA